MEIRFTQLCVSTIFEQEHLTRYSVATRLRCGGYLISALPEIYCWACGWKNFDNRLAFGKGGSTV